MPTHQQRNVIQETPDFFVCQGCGDAVRICEHHRLDEAVMSGRRRLMEAGHRLCANRRRTRVIVAAPKPTSRRTLQSIVLGMHQVSAKQHEDKAVKELWALWGLR